MPFDSTCNHFCAVVHSWHPALQRTGQDAIVLCSLQHKAMPYLSEQQESTINSVMWLQRSEGEQPRQPCVGGALLKPCLQTLGLHLSLLIMFRQTLQPLPWATPSQLCRYTLLAGLLLLLMM